MEISTGNEKTSVVGIDTQTRSLPRCSEYSVFEFELS
jgi:hypothetical protein